MICSKRGVRERPLSLHTRQKSGCCFFSLTSITMGACVAMGACWVMSALGAVWVSVCISYVLVWQGLCSFKSRRQRTVGGGQGALVLAEMFPWVMLTHLGTSQEGWRIRRGERRKQQNDVRGEMNKARLAGMNCRRGCSPLFRLTSGLDCLIKDHYWEEAGHILLLYLQVGRQNWEEFVLAGLCYGQNDNHYYLSWLFNVFIGLSCKQNTSSTSRHPRKSLLEKAISPHYSPKFSAPLRRKIKIL